MSPSLANEISPSKSHNRCQSPKRQEEADIRSVLQPQLDLQSYDGTRSGRYHKREIHAGQAPLLKSSSTARRCPFCAAK